MISNDFYRQNFVNLWSKKCNSLSLFAREEKLFNGLQPENNFREAVVLVIYSANTAASKDGKEFTVC